MRFFMLIGTAFRRRRNQTQSQSKIENTKSEHIAGQNGKNSEKGQPANRHRESISHCVHCAVVSCVRFARQPDQPCSTRPTTYGRGDLTQRLCNQSLSSVFNAKLAFVLGAAEPQVCNPRSSVSNANYHRRSPSLPLLSPLCADDRQKFQSRMLTAGISYQDFNSKSRLWPLPLSIPFLNNFNNILFRN